MMYASAARDLAKRNSGIEEQLKVLIEKCGEAIFESAKAGKLDTHLDLEGYDTAALSLLREALEEKEYSIHFTGAFKNPRIWISW